jgi:N6-adenosine-specific RNA methylase IME4
MTKAGVISADPPWHERTYSRKGMGRSAAAHYDTMTLDEIKALPVADLAARDCALFLWTTWPMLELAIEVFSAWGFHYSSNAWVWVKTTKSGKPRMMGGHTTRKCTEVCLLGLRGNPKRLSKAVTDVIIAPWTGPHVKPDEHFAKVEALYPGPYVELFARRRRPGWNYAFSDQLDTGPTRRRWKSNSYPGASPPLL